MTFNLHENKGPQVEGVAITFLTISWIAIILRIYCRLFVVKSFGIDDYLAAFAQLMFTCFCAFAITGVKYGTGQHTEVIAPNDLILGLKWWWFCEPFYVLSNLTLKFSIGIFLLRIAVMKAQKYILIGIMTTQALYSTYYFFLFVFQCLPVRFFWTQYIAGEEGSCLDANLIVDSTYAYAAISCITDWTYGLLPIWMIYDLQMNSRTKMTVGVILAFAAIGSTATIVRMPYIKGLRDTADFLFATTGVAVWSTAETGIGIIASAVATLRPLFRNILGRNNFLGAASSGGTPNWASKVSPSQAGYFRSTSRSGNVELGLRSDIGNNGGITTTIKGNPFNSTGDVELGNTGRPRKDSQNQLRPSNGWGNSDKLADDSSDEFPMSPPSDWGIRKTMVVETTNS